MPNMRSAGLWVVLLTGSFANIARAKEIPRPTEPIRQEHRDLQVDLRHLDEKLGLLPQRPAAEQRQTMAETVRFLNEHIRPHAAWEERVLYPLVDQKAGSKREHPFTASVRYEHGIVGRRIDELDAISHRPQPDAHAFVRVADKLLGLIAAHFEEEEQVLLPILDATMSPDDFRAVMRAEGDAKSRRAHLAAGHEAPR